LRKLQNINKSGDAHWVVQPRRVVSSPIMIRQADQSFIRLLTEQNFLALVNMDEDDEELLINTTSFHHFMSFVLSP
jgi:hypothetical protein